MNFVGLVAGKGSRMGNLGSYLQKGMYPVLEKPFLQYTLDAIIDSKHYNPDSDRIILVVGHHKDQVWNYFGTAYRGQTLHYVIQQEALGTGHAVLVSMAKAQRDQSTVVWHGDNFVSSSLFDRIIEHPEACCVSVTEYESDKELRERVELGDTLVTKIWCGTGPCIETGPWKLPAHVIDQMGSRCADEYRALLNLQYMMDEGLRIGFVRNKDWIHLGGTEPTVLENLYTCITAMYTKETT